MTLPSFETIRTLHQVQAPSPEAFELIFTHCLIVSDIAAELMRQHPDLVINAQLVKAGALLHDIGAYSLFDQGAFDGPNYITHGIRGEEILTREGFDQRLRRIASHHTGVGLSRDDIKSRSLPLPDEDFLAETIEERLVMYADKFHSKSPRFNTYETYAKTVVEFGDGKLEMLERLKDEFGVPDLELLAGKYKHPIV